MAWTYSLPLIFAQIGGNVPGEAQDVSVAWRPLVAVGVVAASFVLGAMLARRLRMRDYSFKIGLVLFTLIASLTVLLMGWPPKRGIDLSGGVVLIYEVDRESSPGDISQAVASGLEEQLRAAGGGKCEVLAVGANRIDVHVPEGADLPRMVSTIENLRTATDVTLRQDGTRMQDGTTILAYRLEHHAPQVEMDNLITAVGRRINPGGVRELTIRQYGKEQIEVIIPEVAEHEVEAIKKRIATSGVLEFRIVANETDGKALIDAARKTSDRDVYLNGNLVGRWVQAGPDLGLEGAIVRKVDGRPQEVLVRVDPFNVDGRNLSRAASGADQRGQLAVNFSFNSAGAEKFGQLTSRNLQRRLGVVLDNRLLSAPVLQSAIHADGQITGSFTQEQVDFLVGVLNAGSLPATLRPDPISQQRISSQLGDDTIRMGTQAMVVSTAAVLIFMLVYYRFAGLVADIAVVLNMVVTVAIMILIKAAFTLPGLAGLVLTVGMAVDANVLIYERIREETERGASLRMAIHNGFSRHVDNHRLPRDVPGLRRRAVYCRHRPDQGICGHACHWPVDEPVYRGLRRTCHFRCGREETLDYTTQNAARDRTHQHRLHPLAWSRRRLFRDHPRAWLSGHCNARNRAVGH